MIGSESATGSVSRMLCSACEPPVSAVVHGAVIFALRDLAATAVPLIALILVLAALFIMAFRISFHERE